MMMKLIAIAVFCLGVSLSSYTQSSEPPESIYGLYQGKVVAPGLGPDTIRVTKRGSNKAALDVKLYFGHGHLCDLEETAQWTGKSLLMETDALIDNAKCQLEATFDAQGIHLTDKDFRCTPLYCGMRGTLDGVNLPRKKSTRSTKKTTTTSTR